jgi:hypothetical protein
MKPRGFASQLLVVPLLGVLPAITGGCGLLLTHGPPEGHEQLDYFACTESSFGPALDAIWAGFTVLGVLIAASEDDESFGSPDAGALAAFYLPQAVVWGVSAGVGFNKTAKCRAAKRKLAERWARERGLVAGEPSTRTAESLVRSVVLSPQTDTLTVGEQAVLIALAYDADGAAIPNATFFWSSSNDAIASVDETGLVTAHATGTVVIAARTDNVVGTVRIVVVPER